MTSIRIKGFQIWRDKKTGNMYCFHRKTRTPIDLKKHKIGSPSFLAEVARIQLIQDKLEMDKEKPNTLGYLFEVFFETAHFKNLSKNLQKDYRKCSSYYDEIRDLPARSITTPFCQKMFDKLAEKHKFKWANYARTFLSEVFKYNVPLGHIERNFVLGTLKKERPRDLPDMNRNWHWSELEFVFQHGKPHIVQVLTLILWTGFDPTDALEVKKSQVESGMIFNQRNKTKTDNAIPISKHLQETLETIPQHDHDTVLVSTKGEPWSYNGFSTVWHRERARLIKLSLEYPVLYNFEPLAKDLTLKGLRHTLATIIREEGFDERAIADVLGHKTTSMPRHYSKNANLGRKNKKTMKAVEKAVGRDSVLSNHLKKVSKKPKSENKKGDKNE